MKQFFAKICRKTVVYAVRASVAKLSPRTIGEFTSENLATLKRMSYDSRTTVLRKYANNSRLKLSDIRSNVVRHFHAECLATVVRMKMKLKLSYDSRATIARQSRYIFFKISRVRFASKPIFLEALRNKLYIYTTVVTK